MKRVAGRLAGQRAHAVASALLTPLLIPLLALSSLHAAAADMNAVNHPAPLAASASVGSAVPSLGFGAMMQTVFGLFVVIGLVFACAWVARRFGLQTGGRGGLVKTVGATSLGGKERVAVVEIGDTWLVLGAAPGNVRLLHTMPAGSTTGLAGTPAMPGTPGTPGTPLSGTFGQRFREALKGEVGKRFNRPDGRDQ
jgi:flagellar protein FliO/FliZ